MKKRILVPLDGSRLAETVLSYATIFAQHQDAELVLLRVPEYSSDLYARCYEFPPADPELAARLDEKKRAIYLEAMRYIEGLADRLEKDGHKVLVNVREGPVVDVILDCVEKLHIDMIVLSAHARSGYAHWMIGSIAERILHEASIPVLMVRANPEAKASSNFQMTGTFRMESLIN